VQQQELWQIAVENLINAAGGRAAGWLMFCPDRSDAGPETGI